MRALLWVLPLVATGCFRPSTERECAVACPSGICPSGLVCGSDGMCQAEGAPVCSMRDADMPMFDAPPCPSGITGRFLPACLTPADTVTIGAGTINTDTDMRCQVIGNVCAIVGTKITVNGNVRAVGARSLALVSTSTIDITGGFIDVASHRKGTFANTNGAGANGPGCAAVAAISGANSGVGGGGGGAGGSFGARGGNGGLANGGGAAGTAANPLASPTTLRGGCPGGDGGDGTNGNGGASGAGGGALYLLAKGNIAVSGGAFLNASGAGGKADVSGGGGGGSGGLVAFESGGTVIVNSGSAVFAIGGGGSAGGNDTSPPPTSADGFDATNITFEGSGGLPGGVGSEGGDGLPMDGFQGNSASLGGAGGGGGGGFILITAPARAINGTVAPAAM